MAAYDDEIFGPCSSVTRHYQEAVELVNENPYGMALLMVHRARRGRTPVPIDRAGGMVGINVPIPVPVADHSFGGWKNSLFGDRHLYGDEAVDLTPTHQKVVTSRWPDPSTDQTSST